ncbi:hypothetical protein EQG41_04165 [Billgrantia azerbaijanica]|nr:hypothetical protein EQG41_04165 [Halomonas azerbaijanica]
MIKTPTALLAALGLLALPATTVADTLELPADAQVAVTVIDRLTLDPEQARRDDILLHPVSGYDAATHELPEYCVLVGDARLDGERIRITTEALTCIEAEGGDSEIYTGELSAAAYESDGSYGVAAACDGERCELTPDTPFLLQLASPLALEEQANPSAEINRQRRQAEGEGVANPLPAERPDPDDQ